jgi:rod shape-determining protein MreC
MLIKWKQNKKILLFLAVTFFILLYYLTPFKIVVNKISLPLYSKGDSVNNSAKPVYSWWYSVTNGRKLVDRVNFQDKLISELEFGLQDKEYDLTGTSTKTAFENRFGRVSVKSKVIVQRINAGKRELIIENKSDSGIFVGAAAATTEGVYIGKVVSVSENTAAVLLSTDSSSTVAVSLARNLGIQAIIKGSHGVSMNMELIPQDAAIEIGDIVVTSLLEENTPAGLLVGRISSTSYVEGQLFQEATVTPFVNLFGLGDVNVIVPNL